MTPVTLPDKATWREFKASRHDFEPGTCEHCGQGADKLRWYDNMFVCDDCLDWLERHARTAVQYPKERTRQ